MEDKFQELNLRMERLEQKLDTVARKPAAANISEEELQTYQKVKAAFFGPDGSCGINETSPCVIACRVCVIQCIQCIQCIVQCVTCDVECSCGPCNIGGFNSVGSNRFGRLGN